MREGRQLQSMTGFARQEGGDGTAQWVWEVKSVNGKSLDLRLRLPPGYEALEPALRQLAPKKLLRGNLQIGLTVERERSLPSLTVNRPLLARYFAAAKRLEAQGAAPATADGLLALRGVVEAGESGIVTEESRAARQTSPM